MKESEWDDLVNKMKETENEHKADFSKFTEKFEKQQKEETGRVSLDDGYLDKQPADFGLFYTLSETLKQCDMVMKEKPSREISLVKTKLQEALFWLKA